MADVFDGWLVTLFDAVNMEVELTVIMEALDEEAEAEPDVEEMLSGRLVLPLIVEILDRDPVLAERIAGDGRAEGDELVLVENIALVKDRLIVADEENNDR